MAMLNNQMVNIKSPYLCCFKIPYQPISHESNPCKISHENNPMIHPFTSHVNTGVGKCPFLGIQKISSSNIGKKYPQ